jgi:hypothetical protein
MSARTRVGLVEWAQRIELARATEARLAETLVAGVADAPGAAAKVALVREARLHAWHAELWKSVAPLLHDVAVDVGESGIPATSPESVRERLDADYRAWQADASPVAEAPIIRVLTLVTRDHEDDGGS